MPIPLDEAREVVNRFRSGTVATLFAQAHAKHVLHEVRESPENFPDFDPLLEEKVSFTAYALLAAGCSMIEQHDDAAAGRAALERAASLLNYVHGPTAADSRESSFHVLVAGMGFYAAGQYSRAFVTIRRLEQYTDAAKIVGALLRRNVGQLIAGLNELLLVESPATEEARDLEERAISLAIARSIAQALEFTYVGDRDLLERADGQLSLASVVAREGRHPGWWWVVRLLRLMLGDLGGSSPWNVLPPHFGPSLASELATYIRLLAFGRPPVVELWESQRDALRVALNPSGKGGVINLRTSAGKTRVAELAILQTLLREPEGKVLYLAPFRSLAMEIEHALSAVFTWLGLGVSHLYGGSRVSSVDTELAAAAAITIATPEKAKALLRSEPQLFDGLRLIIIDEGHLVGANERYVRNELFVDHLRGIAESTQSRILLLSAVLPNPAELAEWVVGDSQAVASSMWKPSAERFGLLRWNGTRVRIDWQGAVASFNPSFVVKAPLGFGRRRRGFPSDKNEAVAASAVRLSTIGPVMIFAGRAVSVPKLAEAVLLALGANPTPHAWPEHEWRVFEAVCVEELGREALELRAARAGVICHSNRLTNQVRLAIEHLMRSKPPKVIVATTTLAQGVNVGISTVIIASPYIRSDPIDKRDFWNICGRAGRAFVDGEGKVLYAIDMTGGAWKVNKDEALARTYFDPSVGDRVESGLLFAVNVLRIVAERVEVDFGTLLELAARDDFAPLGEESSRFKAICDLLDDELLALHVDPVVNPDGEDPSTWVDRVFRNSLAAIQARVGGHGLSESDVFAFLRARAQSALARVPSMESRKRIVASGLPLSVALRAEGAIDQFKELAETYRTSPRDLNALVAVVREMERWARHNASSLIENMPSTQQLAAIRRGWLGGVGLKALTDHEPKASTVCKDFYGYYLPWVIHAASQQLRRAKNREAADALDAVALMTELGVSTELAARIFLAGVRSREAATELAACDVEFGNTIPEVRANIRSRDFRERVLPSLGEATAQWVELVGPVMREGAVSAEQPRITGIRTDRGVRVLHVRKVRGQLWVTTADGRTKQLLGEEHAELERLANDPRYVLVRAGQEWDVCARDPRLATHA